MYNKLNLYLNMYIVITYVYIHVHINMYTYIVNKYVYICVDKRNIPVVLSFCWPYGTLFNFTHFSL